MDAKIMVEIIRDFDGTYCANMSINGESVSGLPECVSYQTLVAAIKKKISFKLLPLKALNFERCGRKEYAVFRNYDFKKENVEYVDEHCDEFEKVKFYLDDCGPGWVRIVYYNPDAMAGGQLVYNLLGYPTILEAAKSAASEAEFWGYLDGEARQTLDDIDLPEFLSAAKGFVEDHCDFVGETSENMKLVIQWAEKCLKDDGGNANE